MTNKDDLAEIKPPPLVKKAVWFLLSIPLIYTIYYQVLYSFAAVYFWFNLITDPWRVLDDLSYQEFGLHATVMAVLYWVLLLALFFLMRFLMHKFDPDFYHWLDRKIYDRPTAKYDTGDLVNQEVKELPFVDAFLFKLLNQAGSLAGFHYVFTLGERAINAEKKHYYIKKYSKQEEFVSLEKLSAILMKINITPEDNRWEYNLSLTSGDPGMLNDDSPSAEQIKAQNKYGWLGLEYIFNKNDRLHKDYNALVAVPRVIENHCRELAGLILKVTGKEKFVLFTIAQDKYVTKEIINQKIG